MTSKRQRGYCTPSNQNVKRYYYTPSNHKLHPLYQLVLFFFSFCPSWGHSFSFLFLFFKGYFSSFSPFPTLALEGQAAPLVQNLSSTHRTSLFIYCRQARIFLIQLFKLEHTPCGHGYGEGTDDELLLALDLYLYVVGCCVDWSSSSVCSYNKASWL